MSRKQKSEEPGYGRLLDAWVPPEEAGAAVGCVATTFTFHAALFEEECLGRFLQLETDASEQSASYLIEREERLRQLTCAAVLVDAHNAHGPRSLRWDLLLARPKKPSILHAKIALLLWANHARLIVSSANLTESGYRKNREVFGVVDYFDGSESPASLLQEVIDYLGACVTQLVLPGEQSVSQAVQRWHGFLKEVRKRAAKWGTTGAPRGWSQPRVTSILVRPGQPSVFTQLKSKMAWPSASRPTDVFVVSPFFDPPEAQNRPAAEVGTLFGPRSSTGVTYQLEVEEIPSEERVRVLAPQSLVETAPEGHVDCVRFIRLGAEELEAGRPLHAKCLWMENDELYGYLVGSSNFTSAGMGLSRVPNWEANLLYVAHREKNRDAAKAMCASWPTEGDELPDNAEWLPPPPEDLEDAPPVGTEVLPAAFRDATFAQSSSGPTLQLTVAGTPPDGWRVDLEDDQTLIVDEAGWDAAGRPTQWTVLWKQSRPPAELRVQWRTGAGPAWWPVNIDQADSLPPPEELRNLPLELLIEVLTSAQPLHQVLKRLHERSNRMGTHSAELDPHRRIDVTTFLLQRTRRVSRALVALRERLQQPVASEASLNWRLYGPVGVMAFANAIVDESQKAQSEAERGFLLAELALELRRTRCESAQGCLSAHRVREGIREVRAAIRLLLPAASADFDDAMSHYIHSAFEESA